MNEPLKLVEGWTDDIDMQLAADGAVIDITGATVELILKDLNGIVIDTAGDASVLDGPSMKVRYSPDAADLVASKSPCSARFKVTLGGKTAFFPSARPDTWEIQKP